MWMNSSNTWEYSDTDIVYVAFVTRKTQYG